MPIYFSFSVSTLLITTTLSGYTPKSKNLLWSGINYKFLYTNLKSFHAIWLWYFVCTNYFFNSSILIHGNKLILNVFIDFIKSSKYMFIFYAFFFVPVVQIPYDDAIDFSNFLLMWINMFISKIIIYGYIYLLAYNSI